jgi:mercuric ion transport protein
MNDRSILRTGIIGTIIAAICCFTPVLVILVGAVGLSAIVGYLDYVLFPALAIFVLMMFYGIYLRQRSRA